MTTNNDIYSILGKLSALEPAVAKQPSVLTELKESKTSNPLSVKDRLERMLAEAKEVDEDMLAPKKDKAPETKGKQKDEGPEILKIKADQAKAQGKDEFKVGDKTFPVKESDELNEAYINNTRDAINVLANLRAIGKQGERGGQLPPGFANQVVNDLWDVMTWIESNASNIAPSAGVMREDDIDEGVTTQSWMKDPADPASKVPAYQRKNTEPGRQAAQDKVDQMNKNVGANVFKSNRPAPMDEMVFDENDAYCGLPGMRKVTEEEHQEYKRAAHTIRKWMRKRGWDTKKEMKAALKYVNDNLDSKHDDTLTDEVKEACKCCMKHREAVTEAGLDMNLLKGAQGSMKGVNTDPESERNRDKKYGYRSDRDDTGNDDDYDEHGNEKGAKKSAPASDGPKKKGRPKKNFGPERTTAKAYKHKGERKTMTAVKESIKIENYVEDAMAELEALLLTEKAKKPDANKNNIPDYAEDGKGPNDLKKKQDVKEGLRDHPIYTTQEAWDHYAKELEEEQALGEVSPAVQAFTKLKGAPPPHAKQMPANPMTNPDITITPSTSPTASNDRELSELAKLAGLGMSESSCNMTAEGEYCPEHGMNECGMYESMTNEGVYTDTVTGKDYDVVAMNADGSWEVREVGSDKYAPAKVINKALQARFKPKQGMAEAKEELADKDYDEDGKIETGSEEHAGAVDKAIKKAQGKEDDSDDKDKVDENLSLLRMLAGIKESKKAGEEDSLRKAVKTIDEWANSPGEQYSRTDAVIKSGNDLHKSKKQDPKTANKAANPLKR